MISQSIIIMIIWNLTNDNKYIIYKKINYIYINKNVKHVIFFACVLIRRYLTTQLFLLG